MGELSSSFEYGLNVVAKEYDGENKYIRITDIDDDSREFEQEDITSPDTIMNFFAIIMHNGLKYIKEVRSERLRWRST